MYGTSDTVSTTKETQISAIDFSSSGEVALGGKTQNTDYFTGATWTTLRPMIVVNGINGVHKFGKVFDAVVN